MSSEHGTDEVPEQAAQLAKSAGGRAGEGSGNRNRAGARASGVARSIARGLKGMAPKGVHPALIPGVGVEQTPRTYRTDWLVFGVAAAFTIAFICWGVFGGESLPRTAQSVLNWVIEYTGIFFTSVATAILLFMIFLGVSKYGRIKLGRDDEEPEFSMFSWISMLFAAGMGIGLVFWGAAEPLTFFETPPPGTVEGGTLAAMQTAQAQVLYHWGPQAWSFYALVGVAIAYGSFRRGRTPLISSVFAPFLGERKTTGPLGKTIDIFSILVTLFGTAASLGLGALQIGHGVEIVAGIGELGNGILIAVIAILTACFIASAASGVSRGIQALSNVNSVAAILLSFFVFFVGPTLLIMNMIPTIAFEFINDLPQMMGRSAAQGEATQQFLAAWTIFYWAWWISWSPFVGMFIAKISRGRSIRQFVLVVILVPSLISLAWFAIYGTTAIDLKMNGADLPTAPAEDVLFGVLAQLPFTEITNIVLMLLIAIFFITGADSASLVMGTMSQQGRPTPKRWVTITWGTLVGVIAAVLLVAGEHGSGLQALQHVTIIAALPFAVILVLMMFSLMKDLKRDPLMLRDEYARKALRHSVRTGLEEYGDDFALIPEEYDHSQDPHPWVEESTDEELAEVFETASMPIIKVDDGAGAVGGDGSSDEAGAGDEGTRIAEADAGGGDTTGGNTEGSDTGAGGTAAGGTAAGDTEGPADR